jgi:hypothetical protein
VITRFGIAVSALLLACSPIVLAQSDSTTIGRAEALLKNLQAGKFAEVVKAFDPKMAAAIPEERLRAVWEMLTAQFGAVTSIEERRSGEIKGLQAVELILAFEKERVVQRVIFGTDGKIAGLAYNPANMAILPAAK